MSLTSRSSNSTHSRSSLHISRHRGLHILLALVMSVAVLPISMRAQPTCAPDNPEACLPPPGGQHPEFRALVLQVAIALT